MFARLLGGAKSAQVLTAVTVATSALTVAIGHRLSTATFDTVLWTAILLVVGPRPASTTGRGSGCWPACSPASG